MARIVIAEDEIQVRTPAQSDLQQPATICWSAANVAEAQTIINDRGQKYVLLDVQLGNHEEGGLILGKLVAKTPKGTPVLFTSGRTLTDGMQSVLVYRRAFLPMRYTARLLAEAVTELIRAG